MKTDIVTRLRMYAEDLHSAGGFNGYASAMSLAADEIKRLRQAVLDEREACARVVDMNAEATTYLMLHDILQSNANAIRARGDRSEFAVTRLL